MAKEKKRNYQIYGLYCVCEVCEKEDAWYSIKYVGLTVEGARVRFHKHKYSALNDLGYPVNRWMKKHGVENIRWIVLQQCHSQEELNKAEVFWIAELETRIDKHGYNLAYGGEGTSGYTHKPDAKTRQSGRKHSEATRRKISEAVSGRVGDESSHHKLTSEDVVKILERVWDGEPSRAIAKDYGVGKGAILSIAQGESWSHIPRPSRDRKKPPTGRFQTGERRNAKLTEDDVRDVRRRFKEGSTYREIADDYGVTRENIEMVVKRITWKHVE